MGRPNIFEFATRELSHSAYWKSWWASNPTKTHPRREFASHAWPGRGV